MAFLNNEGQSVSYESSKLIVRTKKSIAAKGGECEVFAVVKYIDGAMIVTEFYFSIEQTDETVIKTTLSELLTQLEKQNALI